LKGNKRKKKKINFINDNEINDNEINDNEINDNEINDKLKTNNSFRPIRKIVPANTGNNRNIGNIGNLIPNEQENKKIIFPKFKNEFKKNVYY
jgi:hypothetical protein